MIVITCDYCDHLNLLFHLLESIGSYTPSQVVLIA